MSDVSGDTGVMGLEAKLALPPAPMCSPQLLRTLAQHMKLPFMTIARRAELARITPGASDFDSIQVTADAALHLLDSYLLGIQLEDERTAIAEAEPVSVAAALYDAEVQLRPFARSYGVTLDMRVDGKYGPVTTNRRALQAALTSLGYALIEALPARQETQLRLCLSAHRCRYGIVAGMYCDAEQISTAAFRLGKRLAGKAPQPLNTLTHTTGAGVFIADAILRTMQSRLSVSRHKRMQGLGVVLPLSPQLQLV